MYVLHRTFKIAHMCLHVHACINNLSIEFLGMHRSVHTSSLNVLLCCVESGFVKQYVLLPVCKRAVKWQMSALSCNE